MLLFPLFANCRRGHGFLFNKITLAVATINSSLQWAMHLFVFFWQKFWRQKALNLIDAATNFAQSNLDLLPFLIFSWLKYFIDFV